MNGLTLLALIALAIVAYVAYRAGILAGRREGRGYAPPFASSTSPALPAEVAPAGRARPAPLPASEPATPPHAATAADAAEPPQPAAHDAELIQLRAFAEERRALFAALADARADVARYRQIVVDIENNAPPPLLGEPNAPDDLKLIVGVGPVLERMLQPARHRHVPPDRALDRARHRRIRRAAPGVPRPHPPRRLGHAGPRTAPEQVR
ncbi:MAG: hypothetical protein MZW92_33085 [Comamonadaceae bacterium]|nr:hypothetical protein [Comamonadaceae bacterium]